MNNIKLLTGSEKDFFNFISNIDDKDKVALISHTDGDGISSALAAKKVLGKIDYLELISCNLKMFSKIIPKIKKRKINKIIFADIAINGTEPEIKEIQKQADILIIDHHPYEKDINSEKIIFLKTETDIPASYTSYYLFSKISSIPSWIPAFGLISDLPHKYSENNAYKVFKDFNLKPVQEIWRLVENIVFSLIKFKENEEQIFKILENSNYQDINLENHVKDVKKEFNYYVRKFEQDREVINDTYIYYISPKYSIKSILSTNLSLKQKDKTLVLISETDSKNLVISARRQDRKIDCGKLLKQAIKDIPDSIAGGHIPAAAGKIPKNFLNKFKENLIKIIDKK